MMTSRLGIFASNPGSGTGPGFLLSTKVVGSDEEETPIETDPVALEVSKWSKLSNDATASFMDKDGILNEFDFVFSVRNVFPLHFCLFKQLAAHLPHEANAETTFSLSGSLSNENTCSNPDFMSALVRINKNKKGSNPTRCAACLMPCHSAPPPLTHILHTLACSLLSHSTHLCVLAAKRCSRSTAPSLAQSRARTTWSMRVM